MTGSRPDDLAEARAADRLNTWLDRRRTGATPRPGEPPLAATVRETERLATTKAPNGVIQAHEDSLWEELMLRRATLAPTSIPSSGASSLGWQFPVAGRPVEPPPDMAHRIGHRAMGLVATLMLVALVGLSAFAVYLNAPRNSAPPSSLAAIGLASPTMAASSETATPVRADATANPGGITIWTLPDSAFAEVAPAASYGDGWQPFSSVTLTQQPGTSFQIETRYYVNTHGNRIRIMLVRYVDDVQSDQAFNYFADEIQRYQETMYSYDDPARTEQLRQPLAGCSEVIRTEGLEWVTSFPVTATLCRADNPRVVMLVSVNGDIDLYDGDSLDGHPADIVVGFSLPYLRNAGTPVPNP